MSEKIIELIQRGYLTKFNGDVLKTTGEGILIKANDGSEATALVQPDDIVLWRECIYVKKGAYVKVIEQPSVDYSAMSTLKRSFRNCYSCNQCENKDTMCLGGMELCCWDGKQLGTCDRVWRCLYC
jgi:uncharacterized membrane protein